ncbi:hypothetical protein PROFUN_14420 [Planoprotostelium fungivorum]|uniref:Uncharacterized protein n=1 Tax=Planoprotostelium fungivorum TaxID=1890364 RepID=A0A2P6MX86_9EUKA|nr:hypothetical protein PROFUN_14420 [Planoprotostelium fungivorum]
MHLPFASFKYRARKRLQMFCRGLPNRTQEASIQCKVTSTAYAIRSTNAFLYLQSQIVVKLQQIMDFASVVSTDLAFLSPFDYQPEKLYHLFSFQKLGLVGTPNWL